LSDKENAQHFTGNKKCGGAKLHKGRSPTGVLQNPEPPIRRRSSYRLLCEVQTAFIIFIFLFQ
jgi:hypothetical protein